MTNFKNLMSGKIGTVECTFLNRILVRAHQQFHLPNVKDKINLSYSLIMHGKLVLQTVVSS